jgi:general secretion pathway protein G
MLLIPKNNRGVTLIELVVTMVILSILGMLILPSARVTIVRTKEIELRRNLREIRTAIDEYHRYWDRAVAAGTLKPSIDDNGYPETLEQLVKGRDFGEVNVHNRKFLRRIPQDPFHPVPADDKDGPWHLRAYKDDFDSTIWGGKDVYDVYSWSDGTALDGTKYNTW